MAKAYARLLYTRVGRRPRKVDLRAFPFRIGRDPSCELRIDDPLASPLHAVVECRGEVYSVSNRSVNGTLLSGEPVRGVRTLLPGQRIEIGEGVALEFELPDEKSEKPARQRSWQLGSGWLDRRRALWLGLATYGLVLVVGAVALASLDLSPGAGRATPVAVRQAAEQTRAYLIDQGSDEAQAQSVSGRLDALLFRAWRLESEGRTQSALDVYEEVMEIVPSLRAPTTKLAARQAQRLEEDLR